MDRLPWNEPFHGYARLLVLASLVGFTEEEALRIEGMAEALEVCRVPVRDLVLLHLVVQPVGMRRLIERLLKDRPARRLPTGQETLDWEATRAAFRRAAEGALPAVLSRGDLEVLAEMVTATPRPYRKWLRTVREDPSALLDWVRLWPGWWQRFEDRLAYDPEATRRALEALGLLPGTRAATARCNGEEETARGVVLRHQRLQPLLPGSLLVCHRCGQGYPDWPVLDREGLPG